MVVQSSKVIWWDGCEGGGGLYFLTFTIIIQHATLVQRSRPIYIIRLFASMDSSDTDLIHGQEGLTMGQTLRLRPS